MPIKRESIPSSETTSRKPRRSSTTPEARESRMVSLAETLAERQLEDGTASAQVITHYLKLGSTRERLEQARLEAEVQLQKAKVDQISNGSRMESLLVEAMRAFTGYQGNFETDEAEEDSRD